MAVVLDLVITPGQRALIIERLQAFDSGTAVAVEGADVHARLLRRALQHLEGLPPAERQALVELMKASPEQWAEDERLLRELIEEVAK